MAALSITRTVRAFSAAFAVAWLFGCGKRPDAAQSVPERMPSPTQEIAPSPSSTPPPSAPSLTSSTPQPSARQPVPADDAQASMNRVRARLKEAFGNRSPDLKDIAKLHSVWNETWHPAFDAMLESASSPEVASGQVVPPEIMEHLKDTASAAELFAKDEAGFVSDRKEFEAAYALTVIASSVCMGTGGELPAFLNRAGSLPPTKGDVVVFRALGDGLLFLEHPAVLNDAQFAGWMQLATARNPVYRLIAARTFQSVSTDLAQRSAVYRRLLTDSDPAIARIAVTGAARNVTPETAAALSEFRDRQNRFGNAELVDAAAKALARVEKRP
jgi:hypothetical protein